MEGGCGWTLTILGIFLLGGYLAHITGRRVFVPRVTILLVVGALFGPSLLDIVPAFVSQWFPLVAHMALAMIGFLLGQSFIAERIKKLGRTVLWIAIGETLCAAGLVFCATLIAGAPPALALLLAGIAPASAPAAIFETIRESRASGPLTDTVLGVVAIDDAWGVMIFSLFFVAAGALQTGGTDLQAVLNGLWEVGGAVALGAIVGIPMAWITGRVRQGQPTLVEAAGFVLLCAGAATLLGVSYLLATMIMGAIVANFAKKRRRPFHAIENIREPFLAIFFILAGYRLHIETLTTLGLLGGVYTAARTAGLYTGGRLAGYLSKANAQVTRRVGWCILPQAGVALGFALLVREQFPDFGDQLLSLVIATTVLFEIVGPLAARRQLRQAGEIGKAS